MFERWRNQVEHYCRICDIFLASSVTSNTDLILQIGVGGHARDYAKRIFKNSGVQMNIILLSMPDIISLLLAGKSHKDIDELFRKRMKLLNIL
jgi:hypothetical protein